MQEALQGDWKSDYFRRSESVSQKESNITSVQWLSHKAVTDIHGSALLKVMVSQGKMLTRPHEMLDPDDPLTQTLPPEEWLQYRETTDVDQTTDEFVNSMSRGAGDVPDDQSGDEETDVSIKIRQVRGSHAKFNAAPIDIKFNWGVHAKFNAVINFLSQGLVWPMHAGHK